MHNHKLSFPHARNLPLLVQYSYLATTIRVYNTYFTYLADKGFFMCHTVPTYTTPFTGNKIMLVEISSC